MIFVECSWSAGERLQCEARVHRMGQRSECKITYMLIKGTVDEKLWKSIRIKTKRIKALRS